MKKKGLETLLYSAAGVGVMLLILIAVNVIGSKLKTRIDLTAERAYTLSPGTKAILAKLDTPVQVRFYCTRSDNTMPVLLKTYAQRVEDLLSEFRQVSKGKIEIQKLDPTPDSDAEDSAKLDGLQAQPLPNGERIYLGVSLSMLDQKEAIPFLSPNRERLLEYDLARAVTRVVAPEKAVVGVMSALPVNGSKVPPQMQMQGQRGEPAWVLLDELKRDFNVKTVEMTADKIPDDIKVLLVIHPKGITDATQFAIDQFILRGGKLVAFLDPLAVLDRQAAQGMMMGQPPSGSSLDKLLKAWGLSFDTNRVVADLGYMGRTRQGRQPALLALNDTALNKEDIVTGDADSVVLAFAGAFTGTAVDGLKMTTLLQSSQKAALIDGMSAQMGGESAINDISPTGVRYQLAVRLTGKFKTAFPEGKPKPAGEAPKPEDKDKKPEAAGGALKESTADNTVVLIGDSDMIQDAVSVQEIPGLFGGGQRMVQPMNGNLGLAQSAVEQLTGDSNLVTVRGRASRERPFTVVKQMQANAEANYKARIKELETGLADAQRRLNELQRSKDPTQKLILSPEQQQEIANFRKKESEARIALKLERKKLRADIDSLENRMKWLNIGAVPAAVTLTGVFYALRRRRQEAAA